MSYQSMTIYMDRTYEVYRYYLALKLHFTTDKYDVIKQQGRVRASKQAFYKRKDLLSLRKVAEQYTDQEIVDFLVSNFTSGDRWGGLFDVEAKNRYANWKKRIESLSYVFENEVRELLTKTSSIEECFNVNAGQHPVVLKMYLQGKVSIETLIILNKLIKFVERFDKELSGDIVWPDVSRVMKKYDPFLSINLEKYDRILRRTIEAREE